MKTVNVIRLSLVAVVITMLVVFFTTSCTPDDIVPEKPIRYFPVQIITVDCDPSDITVRDVPSYQYSGAFYDMYGNYYPNEGWYKVTVINGTYSYKLVSYSEAHYDISQILKYLNEDYKSSRIQFYSYDKPISISWIEYTERTGPSVFDSKYGWYGYMPHWDEEKQDFVPSAIILALINHEEYWAKELADGYGGDGKAEVRFTTMSGSNGSTIRHEFDHVFGWALVGHDVPHNDYPRIPENLYDYSLTSDVLKYLASDHPL